MRLLSSRSVITWALAFFLALPHLGFANERNGNRSKLFPLPEILKPNVEFWKKIYGVYSSDQIVLHDNEDLEIVYEIVDLGKLFRDPSAVSWKNKWRRTDKIKDRYRAILRSAAAKIGKKQALNAQEQKIVDLFNGKGTPARLRRAVRNIRGQQGMKERFLEGIKRSGMYHERIQATFKKHKVPPELTFLPHVESSFNYTAYSKVGAAGLWQFTRGTARRFMKVNYEIDQRFDPIVATDAAARLLKDNYRMLGSWPLAITAYNHGPNGMKRARNRFGHDIGRIVREYKSRTFKFASRNFYTEFLAALHVAENALSYFGEFVLLRPLEAKSFQTSKYLSVASVLKAFNLDLDTFRRYNPAVRRPVLRGERRLPRRFTIRVPDRPDVDEKAQWATLTKKESFSKQVATNFYKVRRGDNLSAIARRLGTSVDALIVTNDIDDGHRIFVGQILRLPGGPETTSKPAPKKPVLLAEAKPVKKPVPAPDRIDAIPVPVKAKSTSVKTDTAPVKTPTDAQSAAVVADLTAPAKATTVIPNAFEPTNGLAAPESEIAPPNMRVELTASENGSLILIPAEEPAASIPDVRLSSFMPEPISEWITVEPEETLGHYADWLEISATKLRRLNGLSRREEIHIGQKLHLSFDKVPAATFQRRRFEYQRSIEEDFFSTFAVAGMKTHTVRRGQSIWYITNTLYDLPLWLVAKYNPDRNLRELHVGDQVQIPVLSERTESGEVL